jgi:basic amino acid/polyamine antiporter, APA family
VKRTLGLGGATGVGIGAIVGGGILALAGVAFSATGPGALLAFALNGVIALVTALSFAELSAAFPESGGTYAFAKKFLTVRIAFGVGWVVWFASLVAAVLYAFGFGVFAALSLREIAAHFLSGTPAWLESRWLVTGLAVLATAWFAQGLMRKGGGGGLWINVIKTGVFALVIAGGFWTLTRMSGGEIRGHLQPFLPAGAAGLFQAMGFTFIALQGFDLIAAVAGEVKDPARNIPWAMILSLVTSLAIYLPLLFVITTAGVSPGLSITSLSREEPEAVVAIAARRFLGEFGYGLVMAAGVLSMLSALQANLFAASRVAFAMARDRTLSPMLGRLHATRGVPRLAVAAVTVIVILILVLVPDVATAGAVSSLIFLVTFFLAHGINLLLHRRLESGKLPFRVPFFPLPQILGGLSCLALAVYQGVAVPAAGLIGLVWLGLGGVLYWVRFSSRAQVYDASVEAVDPLLIKYRGRNPLVLVPVHNAANAGTLVTLATALGPPGISRVLLMTVVRPPAEWKKEAPPETLLSAQTVLREALTASFAAGLAPEALMCVSPNHWDEINRVARLHRCESLLLGLRNMSDAAVDPHFDRFLSSAPCDVVLLRPPPGWSLDRARRVLIPVSGGGGHSALRARLLGSLGRRIPPEATYLRILPKSAGTEEIKKARQLLRIRSEDEVNGPATLVLDFHDDPVEEIIRRAQDFDLVILGLHQLQPHRRVVGEVISRIARNTSCALLILGHKT